MSIVAVHGPNTFGSKGVIGVTTGLATADAANGMHWVFKANPALYSSAVAADYDWAYTPTTGTPASGATTLNLGPTLDVVFSGADGNRTVTLTYQNVAQSPTWVVPAATGAAPTLRMGAPPEEGDGEGVPIGFDPAAHTVDEVEAYVTEHPDLAQDVYDAEIEGKARVTLITWLEDFEA
jgi:hypothetical protein